MKELFDKIQQGIDVRENLIKLKATMKEASPDAFLLLLDDDTFFRNLFEHTDPKIRKNAATIIGLCQDPSFVSVLVEQYEKETTLFVRPEYVKVLCEFPVKEYLPIFEQRREEIMQGDIEGTNEKHLTLELRYLTQIISKYETRRSHRFVGEEEDSQIFLTVPKGLSQILGNEITTMPAKVMKDGVLVACDNLKKLDEIRCFGEALHFIKDLSDVEADEAGIGEAMMKAGVMDYLDERHIGDETYRFRLEVRGIPMEERQAFIKKCAQSMEVASGHRLVNSVSDYEVEFRIMMKRTGRVAIFLKLYTRLDPRFQYRRHDLSSSMKPYIAALICQFIAPFTREGARVLDPFCGLGTLLHERNFVKISSKEVRCDTLYGVDISQTALDWAKEESDVLGLPVHYINKDSMEFTHEYPFDEIITELPAISATKSAKEIRELYQQFLKHSKELLTDTGYLFVYTTQTEIFEKCLAKEKEYRILDEQVIYHKQGSKVYVLDRG